MMTSKIMKVEAMVGFLATALGYRPFLSAEQVTAFAKSAAANPRQPPLMIYDTQLVRTWLVADPAGLLVISDDKVWENPTLVASIPHDEAAVVAVDQEPKPVLRFGQSRKALPYSPKLFQRVSVAKLIEEFRAEPVA